MGWFKQGPSPHQTGLAMIGAKAGSRVLFIGADAAALAAQVALVTGLNGRTLVVARGPGARERIERAAAEAGALVEFDDAPAAMLPVEPDAFDIVVLVAGESGVTASNLRDTVAEALRVVRAGGRLIVRTAAKRGGMFGRSAAPDVDPLDVFVRSGAVAGRLLATAEGVSYYEARR
jgi:SAM-dependent methyltransferase